MRRCVTRFVVISFPLFGFPLLLQGCGSGGDGDSKPAPTPAPTTAPSEAPTDDGLKTTWRCMQQQDLKATHHWNVSASQLAGKNRGDVIDSTTFTMEPFRGTFHLKFFPQGQLNDEPGKSSIFLAHSLSEDWNAALEITINGVSRKTENVRFQPGEGGQMGTGGFTNFGDAEPTDKDVEIVVKLSEVQDNTQTLDPKDVVYRDVKDKDDKLVSQNEYSCWRYLQSADSSKKWQKLVARQAGDKPCDDAAKEAALQKAAQGGSLTLPKAECDGNDVLLISMKMGDCQIDTFLENCKNSEEFMM